MQIDPENIDARMNLGRVLLLMGRTTEAAEHFREAVRLKPELRAAVADLMSRVPESPRRVRRWQTRHTSSSSAEDLADWTPRARLPRAPVRITLIDRQNYHLFQPLLYQVATASLSPGDIASPIRWVLRHQSNVKVLLAEVRGIEVAARRIVMRGSRQKPPFRTTT